MTEHPETRLARTVSELARRLRADPDVRALLGTITSAAVHDIDGAQWAGISLIGRRTITTEAATGEVVAQVDRIQSGLGEGPGLSSLHEEATVRCDDLAADPRWPRFADAASALGIASMLSVQLPVHDDQVGALTLYAAVPRAFTTDDETSAMLLASHASIAMRGQAVESNLRTALASRDVIGQAKSILMERYKIGQFEAFQLLVMASQRTHGKVRDIADQLTTTGELRLP